MLRLLRYVLGHPLCRDDRWAAARRVLAWQLASRVLRAPAVVPFTARTSLVLERGMTGATGNYYCGLHEFEDMAFVLDLLRPGDLFVDVGANVGTYTVLAAGHCGAAVVAFEPVPATFERLRRNVRHNDIGHLVRPHNCGVGDANGELLFTSTLDTVNHVATEADADPVRVEVCRLDDRLGTQVPLCVKIDVEGFEQKVVAGAEATLCAEGCRAVLLELNGSGARYGFDEARLHATLLGFGYRPFGYEPFAAALKPLGGRNAAAGNTLYLKDLDFIERRLAEAGDIELPWRAVARHRGAARHRAAPPVSN